MDFAQKLVPAYFGHGEFKNQDFVAQRNGGGAIRGPERGRFSGNHLAEVVRSKPGRRIKGITPHTPPFWAFLGLFAYPTPRG